MALAGEGRGAPAWMRAATSWAPWTAARSVSSSSALCSRADTTTLAATTPAPTTSTDAAAVRALTEPRMGLACHTGRLGSGRSGGREARPPISPEGLSGAGVGDAAVLNAAGSMVFPDSRPDD